VEKRELFATVMVDAILKARIQCNWRKERSAPLVLKVIGAVLHNSGRYPAEERPAKASRAVLFPSVIQEET
jgi:hypothetical protein